MDSRLSLLLFGGFELSAGDGRPVPIPVRKARALLAWLAMQPGHDHSRDRLAAFLWSDVGDGRARHSLRQALSALRKASPVISGALAAGHDHIRLERDVIDVDVLSLERRLDSTPEAAGQWLIENYRGDLLEGMYLQSPPFDEWLLERREYFRRQVCERFEAALMHALDSKHYADAIRFGVRLVNIEPLREDVHRALMKAYAACGRIPDALQQYRFCRAILDKELGVAPAADTESLKVALMSERSRAPLPIDKNIRDSRAAPARRRPELRQVTLVAVAPLRGRGHAHPELEFAALSELADDCETVARRHSLVSPVEASHCFVLVFGSPTTSSNDSLRALVAARELAERGPSRVAVASGRAVVQLETAPGDKARIRRLSGSVLRQVEAMCDVEDDGKILISDPVRLGCIDHVKVTGPLDQRLPGGVDVWRFDTLDAVQPVRPLPGFVGRRLEMGQLRAMLALCREGGHGHVFMIRGDAGIGKSRLVHKAMDEAVAQGDLCIQHRVGDPTMSLRTGLVEGVLWGLLAWARDDANTPVEAGALRPYLESLDLAPELVSFAAALFQPPGAAVRASALESLDADDQRDHERRLFRSLFERIGAERTIVLLVEDIHWAGQKVLSQLAELAALTTTHRLVLAMTSRHEGEALRASWRGAMSGAPMTTIDLKPLLPDACRQLAQRLAGSEHPRLEDCVARSAGNPLFLEQLLMAADHGDGGLPDSIQSIVGARLDALCARERLVVRAAAVLGPRFSMAALRAVVPESDAELESLFAQGLLVVADGEGRFLHELIHRGIYDSMLADELSTLHLKAAGYFASDDEYRHAWHLAGSGSADAERTCHQVAEKLIAGFHYDRAVTLVDHALGMLSGPRDLLVLRARLAQLTGAYREAAQWFRRALESSASIHALIGLAESLIVLDRHGEARDYLARVEPQLSTDQHDLRAKTEILTSRIAFARGYLDRCLAHAEQAMSSAERADSVDLQVEATSTIADAKYQQGQMREAHAMFDRCVTLASAHGIHRQVANNLVLRGWVGIYLGAPDEGLQDAQRAYEFAREAGHLRHQGLIASVLAEIAYERGELEQGAAFARQSLDLCSSVGSVRFEIEAQCLIGYGESILGDRESGFSRLAEGARRMVDLRPAYAGPWLLGMAGYCAPDVARAQDLFEQGQHILDSIDCVSHNQIHFFHYAVSRMLLEYDLSEAERLLARYETFLAGRDVPVAQRFCRVVRPIVEAPRSRRSRDAVEALRHFTTGHGLTFGYFAGA